MCTNSYLLCVFGVRVSKKIGARQISRILHSDISPEVNASSSPSSSISSTTSSTSSTANFAAFENDISAVPGLISSFARTFGVVAVIRATVRRNSGVKVTGFIPRSYYDKYVKAPGGSRESGQLTVFPMCIPIHRSSCDAILFP